LPHLNCAPAVLSTATTRENRTGLDWAYANLKAAPTQGRLGRVGPSWGRGGTSLGRPGGRAAKPEPGPGAAWSLGRRGLGPGP
jgi:hypothetical protein